MSSPTLRDVQARYAQAVAGFLNPYEAAREATMVIEDLTGLSRAEQILRGADAFTGDPGRLDQIIAARIARQPLAQILGKAPFRDRMFHVTPDVLTPRADTETLIDAALSVRPRRLLDLGTGPGTIALTMLAECPEATALATDISDKALQVAALNAARLGVEDRVTLIRSDWLQDVSGMFELIVANPPYVDADTYTALAPEITRWEPQIALTPGGDGLDAYRILARDAPGYLSDGGHLMVEVGFDQGAAVAGLFEAAGLTEIRILPDINGKDRVVTALKP